MLPGLGRPAGWPSEWSGLGRVLSNHVRYVRRRVTAVRGELELADASREPLDARRLTAPAETGLRLLSLATVVLAATLLAFRI
jgi:hypothetical protein